MNTKETHVSEAKKQIVADLAKLINENKTILIASIKNLPASQFQEISKKFRGKAVVKVPKKNLIFRAIESSKNAKLKELESSIDDSFALLFSDLDSFDLAADLLKNKSAAKAKPGQIAPMNIEVEAGMTELVPGPAISELAAVGLKTKVTNGKLEIVASKVIVAEGKEISSAVADVMAKLDIKPFSIGFVPLSAFDTKENKFYASIEIDSEATLEELKAAYSKALAFSVEIGFANSDNISFIIGKAAMHSKAIEALLGGDSAEESSAEAEKESSEEDKANSAETEVKESSTETKKEKSADAEGETKSENSEEEK